MEWKSLVLGVAFCVGIFAVKSGVGLSYYMSKTTSSRARAGAWAGFAATYLLVFAACGYILEKIDLMQHLVAIQEWIQSGMLVHLLMAAMLLLWGLRLLRENGGAAGKSRGWVLLAAPCPVCAMVILFSVGFMAAAFPESPLIMAALLYLVFLSINTATVKIMSATRNRESPESFLGVSMLAIAAYFFLSVTIMPNIADADKIYQMALYPSNAALEEPRRLLVFVVGMLAAFLSVFGITFLRIRKMA